MARRFSMKGARLAAAVALACLAGRAAAMGPVQAYEAALKHDTTYQAAYFDSEAGKEYKAMGRSGLLPSLSANYSASRNRADVTGPDAFGRRTTTQPEYYSRVQSLNLRQGILNLDAVARYKQGLAQSSYSEAQFSSQGQEMMLRVLGAYFDAAFTTEQLRLATASRDMYLEQKRVNDHLFAQGEGTRTDMLETQSRLQLAEAQLLESQDARTNAYNALAVLVGEDIVALDQMRADFPLLPTQPDSAQAWMDLAMVHSPDIAAQRFAVEAAHQELNKDRAGHAPRVDFVASYSKNSAETLNTYAQDSTVRSVGVQISVPLYSGGYVNAASRQAVANQEKAQAQLQAQTDKVHNEIRKQFNAVVTIAARINALDQAVESSKLLVTATEQSIKGGVRINLDLLNAQQQLYSSQRDLAQARYNYLLARMRLHAAAGMLGRDDLREVATYFR